MSLSDALRRFRKYRGITQHQAAEAAGVVDRLWQSYEYGKINPGVDCLIKLSVHYGVSLDYIVGLSDDPVRR